MRYVWHKRIGWAVAVLVALFVAFVLFGLPAMALACAPREIMFKLRNEKWGEVVVFNGLAPSQQAELWFAPDGHWSIIVTMPEGMISCLVSSGTGGELIPPRKIVPGEDS